MSEYFTNGITVYDLDKCLQAIKQRDKDNEYRIKCLTEQNKNLKDEQYKDEQLQEMKKKLERMKEDYCRGFPITESEQEKIDKWKQKHDEEVHGLITTDMKMRAGGAIGGRYSYHFTPTSIGTFGTIRCSCGAEYDFSDI